MATVFMVVPGTRQGGRVRTIPFIEAQAEGLRAGGHLVVLGALEERTSPRGVVRNIRRLRREVDDSGAMVVHAQYGTVTAAVGAMVAQGRPLVVSFCGDDLLGTPNPGLRWRVREAISRRIGLAGGWRAARVIEKSDSLEDALPRRLRKRAVVLPNGVDIDVFAERDKAQCRRELGWSSDDRVVVFNASNSTNQTVKNLPLAQEVIARCTQEGKGPRLHLISGVSHATIPVLLNAADCLLVTSLHEGSPNIVKEAMACNLPVVSVPCGDVAQRVGPTQPGCVASYDAAHLAIALQEVLQHGGRSDGRIHLQAQGLTTHQECETLTCLYQDAARSQQGWKGQT